MFTYTSMVVTGGAPAPSVPGDGEDRILVHLDLTTRELGTDPPPSRCHLRAYKTTSGWVLLLWTPHGPTEAVRAWAKAQTTAEDLSLGRIGERTVGLRCAAIPTGWRDLFGLFDAQHLIMEPDGRARARIEGPREQISRYLDTMELQLATESVKVLPDPDEETRQPLLTEDQDHAIGRAAALGYFEVPRRIRLGELADELGTSKSALSELLRRAQARLVSAYLENSLGGVEAVLDIEEPSR